MLLPDLLEPHLRLVFCGSAPSRASLAARAYYANPGNQFWPMLHRTGFTPRQLLPMEYPELLDYGMGLTDLCKTHSGNDDEIPSEGWDAPALRTKIEMYQPLFLAFTSKTSARLALGHAVDYGLQGDTIGITRIYVGCSTSGRARRFWQESVWQELRRLTQHQH